MEIDSFNATTFMLLSWLINYLLHSSILLGAAILFTSRKPGNLSRVKDTVIKFAVVGSLLTATFQTFAPVSSFTLGIDVPREEVVRSSEPAALDIGMIAPEEKPIDNTGSNKSENKAVNAISGNVNPIEGIQWPAAVFMIWLAGGIVFTIRYSMRWIGFINCLKERKHVTSNSLRAMIESIAEQLQVRRKIRLTSSSNISSPVAFGFKEICIPADFTERLTQDEQYSTLAHEVAHLRRNDPLWLMLFGILRNMFFIQPIIHLIYKRYLAESEFICDEVVMQLTGSPSALARSLYKYLITTNSPPVGQLASTMAGRSVSILERTEKMIHWNGFKHGNGNSFVTILIICGILIVAGWAFPKAVIHTALDNSSTSPSVVAFSTTRLETLPEQQEQMVTGTITWTDGKEYPLEMKVDTTGLQNHDQNRLIVLDGVIKNNEQMNIHIIVKISGREARAGSDTIQAGKMGSGLKQVAQEMIELCDVKSFPELSDIKNSFNEGKYLVSVHLTLVDNNVYQTTL